MSTASSVRNRSAIYLLVVVGLLSALVSATPPAIARAATPSPTQDHFVDCSASGTGVGTQHDPWRSLAEVNEHAPYGPGDRILLKRGTTCRGSLQLHGSGSSARPAVVAAYGTGRAPVIAGHGTPDGSGAVELIDAAHWTVRDLAITNSPSDTDDAHRAGVLVLNQSTGRLSGITIEGLDVHDIVSDPWWDNGYFPHRFGGIAVITSSSVPDAGFSGVRITDNSVTRVGRSGIVTWNAQAQAGTSFDRDVRISGNRVTRAAGDGILMSGVKHGRIDHNVAAHSSNLPACPVTTCPDTKTTASAGIWPIFSQYIRIDHNEAYGTKWGPGDGEGFDIDASTSDVTFEYNYSHDNEGGGILFCGSSRVIVRFNIFQNNSKSAFAFIGTMPAHDTSIYNNTIYQSKRSGAGVVRYFNGPAGSDLKFFNNVVYSYGTGYYLWPTRVTSRNNTFVGTHRSGEPHGRGFSHASPRLRSPGSGKNGVSTLRGYKQRTPRSAKKGVAIPRSVTRDFFGKRINPKHPPRGAAA